MLPVKEILNNIVTSYVTILQTNLIGIYLHGSLAMNCFNPNSSDIDFLVVVKEEPTFNEMRKLINVLLILSNNSPNKGFEMSVLSEDTAKNFSYPTPFILHYSEYHKNKYLNQPDYICGNSKDPDLAAHIVVVKERGICLTGKPINEVFQDVPKKHYIESIIKDISCSKVEITKNPIYYILNLCRVLCFLQSEKICSKKEGGEWAYLNVPVQYRGIIQSALNSYKNTKNIFNIQSEILVDFANFMLKEIGI